ncbi:MAG: isoprenylcysteine carboxylmethyltransferase family protein [Myxococcota bacterium]|nr:isoprenylcysteine carboxylmethyltransferase family protein [Myxococcota bacterium]
MSPGSEGSEAASLLLRNLAFTLLVPGTVAVAVPLWLAGDREPATGVRLVLAGALLALGAGLYAWTVYDFAAWGRGTPAPVDAPRRLVVRGPYRWTRNPMYLGVLGVILGEALLLGAWSLLLYAAGVATAFHLFVVLYEEPHLRRTFGARYEAYRARVPRWLPRAGRRADR